MVWFLTCKTIKATTQRLRGIGLGSPAILWWRKTQVALELELLESYWGFIRRPSRPPVHMCTLQVLGNCNDRSIEAWKAFAFESGIPFSFLSLILHLFRYGNITVNNKMTEYVVFCFCHQMYWVKWDTSFVVISHIPLNIYYCISIYNNIYVRVSLYVQ